MRYFWLIFGVGLILLVKWTIGLPPLYFSEGQWHYHELYPWFYAARVIVMLAGVVIAAVSGARILKQLVERQSDTAEH